MRLSDLGGWMRAFRTRGIWFVQLIGRTGWGLSLDEAMRSAARGAWS